jgi:hypothetical protein
MVNKITNNGEQKYKQWWTKMQTMVKKYTNNGGQKYTQWWTKIQTGEQK